jgi:hypothetical protein
VIWSVNPADGLHEHPLPLCEEHIRTPDDVDPFRYLTNGRISANA